MSFFEEYLSKNLHNPEFKKEWEDSRLEYTIARNIIQRRKNLGLTQQDIAIQMHTQQSVISRIEAGNQNITIGSLKALASILQTDVISLLQDSDQDEKAESSKHSLVRS